MTYRQVGRGVGRTIRAMDRHAKQVDRQRQAQARAAQKQAMLDASADAAAGYEAIVEAMIGAHRVAFARTDWLTDATAPLLPEPQRGHEAERLAMEELAGYAPGPVARVVGLERRRRAKLERAVEAARDADAAAFAADVSRVRARNEAIAHAQRMVALDPDTVADAIQHLTVLGTLPFSVEAASIRFTDDGRIIALVDGLDLDDMPSESVSLLQSGKASFKAMPQGRIMELLRDTICSAAVRVAVELLQAVPTEAVEVVMLSDLLDRGSGHMDAAPVLYVRATAQALGSVNLTRADATALVERLGGHFDWSKRHGFQPINLAAFGIDDL